MRLDGVPGTQWTTSYWAQEVRVPGSRKLGAVAALELTRTAGVGMAWLIDAWGWRPGTPAPQATALPRIDIGQLTVNEGDSGSRTLPTRSPGTSDLTPSPRAAVEVV